MAGRERGKLSQDIADEIERRMMVKVERGKLSQVTAERTFRVTTGRELPSKNAEIGGYRPRLKIRDFC